jgi:ElaB/YqjD/DUF883 family membrane-anchored ribosome-binding protein
MTEMTVDHKEKLMSDLKVVIADAEELLKMTAGQVGDKATELRGRMQTRLEQAKAELARVQAAAVVKAKEAGQATDAYVRENPWQAVGIAAGAGLLIGMLISRR